MDAKLAASLIGNLLVLVLVLFLQFLDTRRSKEAAQQARLDSLESRLAGTQHQLDQARHEALRLKFRVARLEGQIGVDRKAG